MPLSCDRHLAKERRRSVHDALPQRALPEPVFGSSGPELGERAGDAKQESAAQFGGAQLLGQPAESATAPRAVDRSHLPR